MVWRSRWSLVVGGATLDGLGGCHDVVLPGQRCPARSDGLRHPNLAAMAPSLVDSGNDGHHNNTKRGIGCSGMAWLWLVAVMKLLSWLPSPLVSST